MKISENTRLLGCGVPFLLVLLFCFHVDLFCLWYTAGLRSLFTTRANVHVNDLVLAVDIAMRQEGKSRNESQPSQMRHITHRTNEGATAVDSTRTDTTVAGKATVVSDLAPGGQHVAFLFMLRNELVHRVLWRDWFSSELATPLARVSIYFHVADGVDALSNDDTTDGKESLEAVLPGAVRVVPTVATGWCELVAAEVALLQGALAGSPEAAMFVFLPHDAVPLASLEDTLIALLSRGDVGNVVGAATATWPPSRFCPAGIRSLEVPTDCAYAMEPHWSRTLRFKHHQWMALNRRHAERFADSRALRVAAALFQDTFLGEPLCSDEVIPLLTLALPDHVLSNLNESMDFDPRGVNGGINALVNVFQLPLYHSSVSGLADFDAFLQSLDIEPHCILYAPWPGCHDGGGRENYQLDKRAKSPLVSGSLLQVDRDRDDLLVSLAAKGLLFARRLGIGGDSVESHLALIHQAAQRRTPSLPLPTRLFRGGPRAWSIPYMFGWLRWWVSVAYWPSTISVHVGTFFFVGIGACLGAVKFGAVPVPLLRRLVIALVFVHCVIFFISVVAFPEYSLLEPLRRNGMLSWAGVSLKPDL
eukprot:TRINITY_DN25692_c0_g1_i1.p1 TRINITY_DN25692_c0_g1~~TRINITY_DN25692_c0_g1_i1.p1  ORF type:complete len:589 (+),score=67.99 TRINITY_DN25692_c0_g1_i1:83-1849(+)